MLTNATISCYDVMGDIIVAVSVRQQDHPRAAWEPVLLHATAIRSEGETEPREWLQDCLVGLLESL